MAQAFTLERVAQTSENKDPEAVLRVLEVLGALDLKDDGRATISSTENGTRVQFNNGMYLDIAQTDGIFSQTSRRVEIVWHTNLPVRGKLWSVNLSYEDTHSGKFFSESRIRIWMPGVRLEKLPSYTLRFTQLMCQEVAERENDPDKATSYPQILASLTRETATQKMFAFLQHLCSVDRVDEDYLRHHVDD